MADHKNTSDRKLPPAKVIKKDRHGFGKNVTFTTAELPQIKDWEVGRKYKIVVEVTQVSDEIREFEPNKGMRSARFSIDKVTAYKEPIK